MFTKIRSVYLFVENIEQSRDWFAAFLQRSPTYIDDKFASFDINGIKLCFHLADAKTPRVCGGSVSYWWVDDFDQALEKALEAGATLYRGPIESEQGERICQIKDPFGNVFGIEGQAAK